MFEFLGKIPQNIIVATSGNKNSMAMVDFLSRTDRNVSMLYVDYKEDNSKDRIDFLKSYSKTYKIPLEVVKSKLDDFSFLDFINHLYAKSPKFVIMGNVLEDAVVSYVVNSLKLKPILIQYRQRNIIRPYLTTKQEEIDYWVSNKNVSHLKFNKKIVNDHDFVRKYMLENSYKVNPNIAENIAIEINREFDRHSSRRNDRNG